MNRKTIEFNPDNTGSTPSASPWAPPVRTSSFNDLLLQPDYSPLRYKFSVGETRIRILPALQNSTRGWMLGVHALNYPGGRHPHARTLNPKATSVFDIAYRWFRANLPGELFSKQNRTGYKLLSDPVSVFWMVVQSGSKTVPRLFVGSGYNGKRGGMPGLGHQIWQVCQSAIQTGDPAKNALHPDTGVHLIVEKRQQTGVRYPGYSVQLDKTPAPLDEITAKMDPQDLSLIRRLEDVLYLPGEEEEWEILQTVVDPATVNRIRASLTTSRA